HNFHEIDVPTSDAIEEPLFGDLRKQKLDHQRKCRSIKRHDSGIPQDKEPTTQKSMLSTECQVSVGKCAAGYRIGFHQESHAQANQTEDHRADPETNNDPKGSGHLHPLNG